MSEELASRETLYVHNLIWMATVAACQDEIDILDEVIPLDVSPPALRTLPYGRALGVTSNGATTNYMINFACTDEQLGAFIAAGMNTTIGLYWWRCNAEDGRLVATNFSASNSEIGNPFAWQDALEAAGLVFIVPDVID